MLDDFHDRLAPDLSADAIAAKLRPSFAAEVAGAMVNVLRRPAGRRAGHGRRVQAGRRGPRRRRPRRPAEAGRARRRPTATSRPEPRRRLHRLPRRHAVAVPRHRPRQAKAPRRVHRRGLQRPLQVYLGSLYVNDFNRFGRTWQVNVQADARLPRQADDLKQLKVQNADGDMVPLGASPTVRDSTGPVMVSAYNMYPAATVNGDAGARRQLRRRRSPAWSGSPTTTLPPSMRPEWTELAFLQLQTGNTAMLVFVLAVVLVFLVLAAQYESWSLPLAVILVVPMCLLCARSSACCMARIGHQHLHADRLRRARRPGVQERDPDRRVRQGTREDGGDAALRGRRWRRAGCGCGRS